MKKNKLFLLLMVPFTALLSSCSDDAGGKTPSKKELSTPSNFTYVEGVVSFDAVQGATEYDYVFKHKESVVFEDTLTVTSLDVTSLGLEGNIDLTVTAVAKNAKSKPGSYSFAVLTDFDEVIFEAENYLFNFGTGKSNSNFRNNALASGGAYVGGLDDAGHGIYINYLSPCEGDFTFESYYCFEKTTSANKAHHDVWINGSYQTGFEYTEQTGWGGPAQFNPAKSSTTVHLLKGWNTISIMKNGDSSDNWGDFAEIDYLRLVGNGTQYNVDDLDNYGEIPSYYRLEAEMGSPRKKNTSSNVYECKNPCAYNTIAFSNGFLMGNIESTYDGVEWHFDSPVAAKYRISIAYASGQFSGSSPAKPSFVVTDAAIGLQKNVDFQDYEIKQMDPLPYVGWDNPTVATQTIELNLIQGDNFIYCIKYGDSGFFQIDYCDLVFVEEIL